MDSHYTNIFTRKSLAIALITIGVILSACGFSTSSEPDIVAQQTLRPRSTDTPPPQVVADDTSDADADAPSLPQETEEPSDAVSNDTNGDTQATPVPDEPAGSTAPLETEEPAEVDLDAIPETVAVSGQIVNGTEGATPPENLMVEVVSVELTADRQPIGVFESQELQATGTTFRTDSLQIAPNAAVVARVEYGGVLYVSDPVLGTEINDPEINVPLTVYESTTDSSAVVIEQAWYIVGASPQEELTEVLMWFFVRNDSDRVIYSDAGGGIQFDLPQDAFGIRFDNDPAERYIVDESGDAPVITDTEPLRPGQQGLITVTYLLPYTNAEVTLTDPVDFDMEAVTVYLARIFELELEGDNFTSTGVRPIQTLGDYDSYTLQGDLQAGETLTFTVSGDELRPEANQPANNTGTVFPEDQEEGFLERNATIILVLGVLLVVAGFAYLFLDLQRQRLLVQAQLAGASRYDDDIEEDREDLLDAIADLDDMFEAGEIDEEEYERRRERLKKRLRRLM